jgi:23S rRNA (cytosine1962-C5)-methyltransferase
MKVVRLRDGKERSLLRRHPWLFEGGIEKGGADSGETVRVQGHDGRFLAWGSYSPRSSIRVRAWASTRPSASMRRSSSVAWPRPLRCAAAPIVSDAVRLVHGEADGLPGLIVDRYADVLSVQFWPPVSSVGETRSPTRCCA